MRYLAVWAALAIPCFAADEKAPTPPEGFKAIFDGKTLEGWKANGQAEVWGAEDGVIFCKGGGGGYLFADADYDNFELRLKYKLPKGGNSGVALHTPRQGDPAYVGIELQLIDDEGWPGKLLDTQHTGSIYGVVPAAAINNKPIGEWNEFRVVCVKGKVVVENNGKVICEGDTAVLAEKHAKQHPRPPA